MGYKRVNPNKIVVDFTKEEFEKLHMQQPSPILIQQRENKKPIEYYKGKEPPWKDN